MIQFKIGGKDLSMHFIKEGEWQILSVGNANLNTRK